MIYCSWEKAATWCRGPSTAGQEPNRNQTEDLRLTDTPASGRTRRADRITRRKRTQTAITIEPPTSWPLLKPLTVPTFLEEPAPLASKYCTGFWGCP